MPIEKPPIKVQIAIQGGGARLVALIAAMQALEQLESEGHIQVTRLAGTSAGAIAAVLFAAKIPMSAVRHVLTSRREQLVEAWRLPSGFGALIRVFLGRALWNADILENELRKLLIEQGRSKLKGKLDQNAGLGDLEPPVMTVATDLDALKPHIHRDGDGILSSIMHSSALPFLFRAHKSNPRNPVDGGICDNLPASCLMGEKEEAEFGPTIGISFFADKPTKGPAGVLEYALAIVNSSINHSVERSKQLLGPRCIQLVTKIQTFDFEMALGDAGLGQAFDTLVETTKKDLLNAIKSTMLEPTPAASANTSLNDDDWKMASATLGVLSQRYTRALGAIGQMYNRQHHHQTMRYVSAKLVLIANSLAQPPMQPGRDQITSTSVITTSRDPIYCHRMALGQSGAPETVLDDSLVSVFNSNGTPVGTIVVPMDSATNNVEREVLLCFDPLLTPETGPYTVRCRSAFSDFLKPLRDTGQDEIGLFLTRAEIDAPVIDIVLAYPISFGRLMVNSETPYEVIQSAELETSYGDVAPQEYTILGWRARNVRGFTLKVARVAANP